MKLIAVTILTLPVVLIIAFWCCQDAPVSFKIFAICMQSSGAMIGITALVGILLTLVELKNLK